MAVCGLSVTRNSQTGQLKRDRGGLHGSEVAEPLLRGGRRGASQPRQDRGEDGNAVG